MKDHGRQIIQVPTDFHIVGIAQSHPLGNTGGASRKSWVAEDEGRSHQAKVVRDPRSLPLWAVRRLRLGSAPAGIPDSTRDTPF